MSITESRKETRLLVQVALAACENKKAEETRILELDPVDSGLTDYFLITSATNTRQAIAIADEIEYKLKHEFGVYAHSVEGRRLGEWILLDYVDFVVHVFLTERRAFYDIERLRKSARPLTPAEFDAELKADLSEKTRVTRSKAKPTAKNPVAVKTIAKKAAVSKVLVKKSPAKKAVVKTTPAKKAVKPTVKKIVKKSAVKKVTPAAKKIIAVKSSAKKTTLRKAVVKKTGTKKIVGKKIAIKKIVAKKTVAKKAVVKKVAPRKVPAKKAVVKKAVAKKTFTKKAPAKKAAPKKTTKAKK